MLKPENNKLPKLTALQYKVTQEAATEPPFSGKYDTHWEHGSYNCICCGAHLFNSQDKFDSGCGWPSYFKASTADAVLEHNDYSYNMLRMEVRCNCCGAHLGHVFEDGPLPTGMRYCVNSAALNFVSQNQSSVVSLIKNCSNN